MVTTNARRARHARRLHRRWRKDGHPCKGDSQALHPSSPRYDTRKTPSQKLRDYVLSLTPRGISLDVRLIHSGDPIVVGTDNPFIHAATEAMRQVFDKDTVFVRGGRLHPRGGRLHAPTQSAHAADGLRPARRQPACAPMRSSTSATSIAVRSPSFASSHSARSNGRRKWLRPRRWPQFPHGREDKAHVHVGGKELVEHAVQQLQTVCSDVYILERQRELPPLCAPRLLRSGHCRCRCFHRSAQRPARSAPA